MRGMSHAKTRLIAGFVLAGAVVALSGCGAPPWSGATTATPSPTPTPTQTEEIESIVNDLGTGSTRRQLGAGNIALTVDYWSDLSMDQWTAGANKPLRFSLSGALVSDEGQQVYLSKVNLVAAVSDGDTALPAPAAIFDQANISPGYLIKAPYSYSQTFVIPSLDPAATSITIDITYELLLQTTPTSGEYAKQTATDTLTIAIAQ